MAIGALLGEPHSFIHDLESLFWILFWICIYHCDYDNEGKVKRRIVPEFEDWNYFSIERLASEKTGRISKGIFDNVEEKFTDHCKPLVPCLQHM